MNGQKEDNGQMRYEWMTFIMANPQLLARELKNHFSFFPKNRVEFFCSFFCWGGGGGGGGGGLFFICFWPKL